jgi:hypothetical protein
LTGSTPSPFLPHADQAEASRLKPIPFARRCAVEVMDAPLSRPSERLAYEDLLSNEIWDIIFDYVVRGLCQSQIMPLIDICW